MSGHGVYVYAIVRAGRGGPGRRSAAEGGPGAGRRSGAAGRSGGRPLPDGVRMLREGPLAAVVADAPERVRPRRRDLMTHQELLLALAEEGAVLPMRFGMVARDENVVRDQLATGREAHLAALDRLDGRVEMNLKALPASDALAALVTEEPKVRRLREEARRRPGYEANLRLGEAVSEALARRAAEAADRAVRELAALAEAAVPGPDVAGCVRNVSFLVRREAAAGFLSAADRLAAAYRDRAELRAVGPLPCYSFAAHEPSSAAGAAV
ncbi:GvpL/GvpF family gas vesicle protein [Streptacidiphilus sp. ASG 303]|uniref:GvpL/GvpF family gas vesicle protein n=1 Tax=Streptacidiphilus sp. ASG 303 TaxID=2896847 RepID=UPI001E43DDAE|nr:GvpL/GvpF family gas vesicle protein [Streptacidiphilus sp. ASG 303]MCD0485930.1 GvpL/GvpF family gas vesicle protein [Streptacidiphilus sp. ASG 303]